MANYLPGPCAPFTFLSRAFRENPFCNICPRNDWMDSGTNDESYSTGGTSVLIVAGLATLQQVPARIFLEKFGCESQNNPVKK